MKYIVGYIKRGKKPMVQLQGVSGDQMLMDEVFEEELHQVNGSLTTDKFGNVIYDDGQSETDESADGSKKSDEKAHGKGK